MNKIAVCIIYAQEDEPYLIDCLNSIPQGIEVILMHTKPKSNELLCNEKINPIFLENKEFVKHYLWNYYVPEGCSDYDYSRNTFNFSTARNVCKSLTDADIIISLDADEQLCMSQKEQTGLEQLPETIGGVYCRWHNFMIQNNESKAVSSQVIRIFRREFNFEFRCHEQIILDINRSGKQIIESTILIKHLGCVNNDKNYSRTLRNIALISSELISNPLNKYLLEKQYYALQMALNLKFFEVNENELIKSDNLMQILENLHRNGVETTWQRDNLIMNISLISQELMRNPKNHVMLKNQFINLYIYNIIDQF